MLPQVARQQRLQARLSPFVDARSSVVREPSPRPCLNGDPQPTQCRFYGNSSEESP